MSDMQIQGVLQQMRALAQASRLEGVEALSGVQAPGESLQGVFPQMRALAQASRLEDVEAPSGILAPGESRQPGQLDFAETLKGSLRAVNGLQQESAELQTRFELGDANVSLPQVMVAMTKSSLAFEATNQIRNRLLTAYQEVMRMSV